MSQVLLALEAHKLFSINGLRVSLVVGLLAAIVWPSVVMAERRAKLTEREVVPAPPVEVSAAPQQSATATGRSDAKRVDEEYERILESFQRQAVTGLSKMGLSADIGGDDRKVYGSATFGSISLDIADNGVVYLAIEEFYQLSGWQIDVWSSQDGGASWYLWGSLWSQGTTEEFFDPSIQAPSGDQNRVILVYTRSSGQFLNNLIFAVYSDQLDQASWSSEIAVMADVEFNYNLPSIVTDQDKFSTWYIYVVAAANGGGGTRIHFTRSISFGASYEAPYAIGIPTGGESHLVGPKIDYGGFDDCLHAAWTELSLNGIDDYAIGARSAVSFADAGLPAWNPAVDIEPADNQINEVLGGVIASHSNEVALVAYNRLDDQLQLLAPAAKVSTDGGVSYQQFHTLTRGPEIIDDLAFDFGVLDLVGAMRGTDGPSLIRASVFDPTNWSAPQTMGDIAYTGLGTGHLADDVQAGGRMGIAFPDFPVPKQSGPSVFFDAEWHRDSGWANHDAGMPVSIPAPPASAPALVDIDGDPELEIVYADVSGWVYVLDPDGTVLPGWPYGIGDEPSDAPVAVGDLRGDGIPTIVVGSYNGGIHAINPQGQSLPGFPIFGTEPGQARPVIGAMGDTFPRTIVFTSGSWLQYANHLGMVPSGAVDIQAIAEFDFPPAVGDIDGDGVAEAVAVVQNVVYAAEMTQFPADTRAINFWASAGPSLGDLDQDGDAEIVVNEYIQFGGINVLNGDLTDFGNFPILTNSVGPFGPAAIANILGTTDPEIIVSDGFSGESYVYYSDGQLDNDFPTSTAAPGTFFPALCQGVVDGPIVGNVDDVWFPSEIMVWCGKGYGWAWDNFARATAGWPKPILPNLPDVYVAPAIGDVDDDGMNEIVVFSGSALHVLQVDGPPNRTREHWPMIGYDAQRTSCFDCGEAFVQPPNVVINEFAPAGGVAKRIGELIELRNLDTSPVDLTGWLLGNGSGPPTPDTEPVNGVIPAGGLLLHTLVAIDLPDAGGTLELIAPGAEFVVDAVSYGSEGGAPAVPAGFTIQRVDGTGSGDPDAGSFETGEPTPGAGNAVPAPKLGESLLVNEVYYNGAAGEDYIELINPLGTTIALDQFQVADGSGFLDTLPGVQLGPGQIFMLDSSAGFTRDLTNSTLYIYQITESSQSQRIDQLGWGASSTDPPAPIPVPPTDALVRTPDGIAAYLGDQGSNWLDSGGGLSLFYGPPTPGSPNITSTSVVFTVDPGGGGDFMTITDAMNAAVAGVIILVEPGTYNESIFLADGVELVGNGSASQDVVIAGNGATRAVTANGVGNATQIRGVTIQSVAGGMEIIGASPSLSNVWFMANQTVGAGAALTVTGGSPSFSGCVFKDNESQGAGGAVQVNLGNPSFAFCLFVSNTAATEGGAMHQAGGSSQFDNCVFDLNAAYQQQGGTLHVAAGDMIALYSTLTRGLSGAPVRNSGGGSVEFSCGLVDDFNETAPGGDVITMTDVLQDQDPAFCQPLALNYSYPTTSPITGLTCGTTIGVAGPPCGLVLTSTDPIPRVAARSELYAPIPNPFNPATTLKFDLSKAGSVSLEIFDVRGRKVASPVSSVRYDAGTHDVIWRGLDTSQQRVASGVYFARLKLDGTAVGSIQRMVLLK